MMTLRQYVAASAVHFLLFFGMFLIWGYLTVDDAPPRQPPECGSAYIAVPGGECSNVVHLA